MHWLLNGHAAWALAVKALVLVIGGVLAWRRGRAKHRQDARRIRDTPH